MSIYILIAAIAIAAFIVGWNAALHLPYYYHPQIRKRLKLSPKLKKQIRRGNQ